jgi:uncharacterized protein YqgV (UPF0045/DUF77 family)
MDASGDKRPRGIVPVAVRPAGARTLHFTVGFEMNCIEESIRDATQTILDFSANREMVKVDIERRKADLKEVERKLSIAREMLKSLAAEYAEDDGT